MHLNLMRRPKIDVLSEIAPPASINLNTVTDIESDFTSIISAPKCARWSKTPTTRHAYMPSMHFYGRWSCSEVIRNDFQAYNKRRSSFLNSVCAPPGSYIKPDYQFVTKFTNRFTHLNSKKCKKVNFSQNNRP